MEMSIASLSMSMNSAALANEVSMSLLNMTMDSAETQSAGIVDLIDSVDPNLGMNFDVTV